MDLASITGPGKACAQVEVAVREMRCPVGRPHVCPTLFFVAGTGGCSRGELDLFLHGHLKSATPLSSHHLNIRLQNRDLDPENLVHIFHPRSLSPGTMTGRGGGGGRRVLLPPM
jgi:hypothetical protein